MTSDQLKARLDEERGKGLQSALKRLGFDKIDDAETFLKTARTAADAQKTEAEKMRERLAALEPLESEVKTYRETLGNVVKGELEKLIDAQRTAVIALGGEDPAKQLHALAALQPTWTTAAIEPAKEVPKPATTAPATAAPAPAPTTPPTNHRAVYEQLKQTNAMQAAQYLMRHRLDIYPTTNQ
jgi:hypothetical protein